MFASSSSRMPPASTSTCVADRTVDTEKGLSPVSDSVTQIGREDREDQERDRDRTCTNSFISSRSDCALATDDPKNASPVPPCPPPPPFQARFWNKDPATAIKRKIYAKVLGMGTFLVILVIFAVLSIFWGALYNVDEYIHRLEGWVIDYDGGPIGQTVIDAFMNNTGRPQQMTWRVVDASQFPNFPDDVVNAVVGEKTWAAVTINPGATENLSNAIAFADSTYDGSSALTAWAAEARSENGYHAFIQPTITMALSQASQAYSVQSSLQLAANESVDVTTLLALAPNVVTTPVYYTIANLRPFDVPVAQAVDFVGLIYLLIIAFVVSMMNYNARVAASGLNRHLRLSSLILMRMAIPIILYFFVSLFFSLLSLAFQAPFDRFYGHAGFVIYWMMNWAGMCALGLAMESMITLLTPAFISFFLMLWIISNTSVSGVPIEVLPSVFYYGYATPFYNVSQTVRTLLFNTRNQIGLNFGVQFAWIGVSLLFMTLFTILLRKREQRQWKRQQDAETTSNKEKV